MSKKIIKNAFLIKYFIYPWIICYFILSLIPARGKILNFQYNFFINLLFIVIIIVTSIILYLSLKNVTIKKSGQHNIKKLGKNKMLFLINFSSIVSLLGIIMMIYDRIFIRGINYSVGFRDARYQWLNSEGGSFFSILGNVMVPLSYVALFFVIVQWENLEKKYKFLGLFSGILIPFLQALLNGGRSNAFLLILYFLCLLIIRKALGKTFLPKMKFVYFKVFIFFLISLLFAIAIFSSSSKISGSSEYDYMKSLVNALHGELDESYTIENSSSMINKIVLVSTYLFHGQWTAQETYSLNEKPGDFVFSGLLYKLRQLNLYTKEEEPNYFSGAGTFISLPGGIYYDFGLIGVLIGAIIIGILLGIALNIINKNNTMKNGYSLSFVIAVFMLLLNAPVVQIDGFAYFAFIIMAFIGVEIVSRLIYGKSSWVNLE